MAAPATQKANGRAAVAAPPSGSGPGSGDVGMDSLVIQAAHAPNRFLPGAEVARAAAALARRPRRLAARLRDAGREAGAVVAGSSALEPRRGDRRFADPAWQENWMLRRLLQGYLAAGDLAHGLIDDAALETADAHRLRFVAGNLIDALAPTNFPLTNPAALRAAVDTGGANFAAGARALVRDARSPARIPANVDRSRFGVGENLATTPGAVVERHEMYELLQYRPATEQVRCAPLVVVPPMISKYYVVDLSPGRSLAEWLVDRGQQVMALSWRNPTAAEAEWDLDSYAAAILDAIATARAVTRADRVHLLALCAGGVATAAVLGHLAHAGALDQIAGVTLSVTTLDTRRAGTIGSFVSPDTAAAAVASVHRKGYLDRHQLLRTFAWLRPNEMIWGYWINNYLLGKDPPAFDLLYWNADTMDMPAGLHRDFVHIGLENPMLRPGGLTVLGSPVDLAQVDTDAYVVAGETDHITPWRHCYRSTQLLGGESRFVLSSGGHIAAVINPPGRAGGSKSRYRCGPGDAPDGDAWAREREPRSGSWWEDWDAWLAQRSDGERAAPRRLGSRRFPKVADAPGAYVLG